VISSHDMTDKLVSQYSKGLIRPVELLYGLKDAVTIKAPCSCVQCIGTLFGRAEGDDGDSINSW
jgi:hypothetical protein